MSSRNQTALAALCRRRGRTVRSVAAALDVPAGTLYNAGCVRAMPDELAGLVAAELGVPLDELRLAVPELSRPLERAHDPHYEAIVALKRAGVTTGGLAKALGVQDPAASTYLHGWKKPPERFVAKVEELTGEPREALFPQLFEVDAAEFGADETDAEAGR